VRETLVDQVQEFLRPYGMFLMPATPGEAIGTKRGGRVYLTQTPEGLQTKIVRRDGRTVTDVRPADDPGKLALAVRALVFRSRA
jgi:hypothetical protein